MIFVLIILQWSSRYQRDRVQQCTSRGPGPNTQLRPAGSYLSAPLTAQRRWWYRWRYRWCGGTDGVMVQMVGGTVGVVVQMVWWYRWCGGTVGVVVQMVWWPYIWFEQSAEETRIGGWCWLVLSDDNCTDRPTLPEINTRPLPANKIHFTNQEI